MLGRACRNKAEGEFQAGRARVHKKTGTYGVTRPPLSAVLQLRSTGRARAMDTTEDVAVRFNAVTDNAAIAVWTNRRQCVDCALEAVEDVTLSSHNYFKRLVILGFANFAFRHTQFVRARGGSRRCFIYIRDET